MRPLQCSRDSICEIGLLRQAGTWRDNEISDLDDRLTRRADVSLVDLGAANDVVQQSARPCWRVVVVTPPSQAEHRRP